MHEERPSSRFRLILAALFVLVGIAAVVWHLVRSEPLPVAAPAGPAATPPARVDQPAVESAEEPRPPKPTEAATPVIMPLTAPVLEDFQEASSRAMQQLTSGGTTLPYPVAASLAARRAMAELGCDPDLTLKYWLSAQFLEDVAAGDPAAALSARRTVDNMLSILLGDQAGPAEFEQIASEMSSEVRALAIRRHARNNALR